MTLPQASRIQVLAPVVRARKGEYAKVFEDARKSGYVRARVDGITYDLGEEIKLDKNKKHTIEIIVDRLVIKDDIARRLTDSVETAANLAGGLVVIDIVGQDKELMFSQNYACDDCGVSIEELTPRLFSFNSPYGACPACTGLGTQLRVDPDIIIPNQTLSILEGAITASGWGNIKNDGIAKMYFEALAKKYKFTLNTPIKDLPDGVLDIILYGSSGEKLTLHYDPAPGQGRPEPALRGHRQESGAPVQGDPEHVHAVGAGAVHVGAPLPGMRRQAPEKGGPRRHGGRREHRGFHGQIHRPGAGLY